MKVDSKMVKCMVRVIGNHLKETNTKGSILIIKKMGMVFISGRVEKFTKVVFPKKIKNLIKNKNK